MNNMLVKFPQALVLTTTLLLAENDTLTIFGPLASHATAIRLMGLTVREKTLADLARSLSPGERLYIRQKVHGPDDGVQEEDGATTHQERRAAIQKHPENTICKGEQKHDLPRKKGGQSGEEKREEESDGEQKKVTVHCMNGEKLSFKKGTTVSEIRRTNGENWSFVGDIRVGEMHKGEVIAAKTTGGKYTEIFMGGQADALADDAKLEAYDDDDDDAGKKKYFALHGEMVLVRSSMKGGKALTFPVGTTVGDAKRAGARKTAKCSAEEMWTDENMTIFMEAEDENKPSEELSDDVELEAGQAYVASPPVTVRAMNEPITGRGVAPVRFPVGTKVGDAKRKGAQITAQRGDQGLSWEGKEVLIYGREENDGEPLDDDVEMSANQSYFVAFMIV